MQTHPSLFTLPKTPPPAREKKAAPRPAPKSASEHLSPVVWAGGLVLALALGWSYQDAFQQLMSTWNSEPDYSHGFLVPVFAVYLLWHRRHVMACPDWHGSWWGAVLLLIAASMRWGAELFFYPRMDAPSLIPCLLGVALLVGGSQALRWSWPAILYLVFMYPLPGFLATGFSHPLQRMATLSSTWILQTLGLPAVAQGNVILLTTGKIGVVEACSGLRMLMVFLAITVGASLVIRRPLWEKLFVGMSALIIALIANVLRISVTALLYEYVGAEWAERVFHDMAGWLMMPVATGLLFAELYLLSKLIVSPGNSKPFLISR